jgi:hypothetical protein
MASFGSKWEPLTASSHDHEHPGYHAQHIHRGSISGGSTLEAANKLDPILGSNEGSANHGPHSTNIANKLDPRVDSDTDHRGTDQGSTNHGSHSTNVDNKLDPCVDSDLDYRGPSTSQPGQSGAFTRRGTEPSIHTSQAHQSETRAARNSDSDDELRRASLSQDSTAPLEEPKRSTAYSHKSDFLNLLDPRVDHNGAKQMRSSGS